MAHYSEDQASQHWVITAQSLLARLCILVASIAMVVLVVTFGWLVFGRYVLNVTPTWVEQLALVLICYIAFIGAAVGIYEQTHLGVTVFRDLLPKQMRRIVLLFTDVVLAGFGFFMLSASLELFEFGWSTLLPMLNIPESIRTLPSVLCGGLIMLFCGLRIVLRTIDLTYNTQFVPDQEEDY